MPQLIVRNVAPQVVRALRIRAAHHNRSAEAEHREILREVLVPSPCGESFKDALLRFPPGGTAHDFRRSQARGRKIGI